MNYMNCPDIGSEKLEEYAEEYSRIEKKLKEIPEDNETIRKILEWRQQQILGEVSRLHDEMKDVGVLGKEKAYYCNASWEKEE